MAFGKISVAGSGPVDLDLDLDLDLGAWLLFNSPLQLSSSTLLFNYYAVVLLFCKRFSLTAVSQKVAEAS